MTEKNSTQSTADVAGDDDKMYEFGYGHGRMPLFMKIVWIGFLALSTWYIVANLLPALTGDIGG